MLVNCLSKQTARREGIQEWIPEFLRFGIQKDIWKKGYFYLWKVFYSKRKCVHLTTPIFTLACTEKRNLHFLGDGKHQNVPQEERGCRIVPLV